MTLINDMPPCDTPDIQVVYRYSIRFKDYVWLVIDANSCVHGNVNGDIMWHYRKFPKKKKLRERIKFCEQMVLWDLENNNI